MYPSPPVAFHPLQTRNRPLTAFDGISVAPLKSPAAMAAPSINDTFTILLCRLAAPCVHSQNADSCKHDRHFAHFIIIKLVYQIILPKQHDTYIAGIYYNHIPTINGMSVQPMKTKLNLLKPHIILLLCSTLLLSTAVLKITYQEVFVSHREQCVVVIDVGHGGYDPGKVSSNNVLEKDVNLAIALKLKSYLEAQDCLVYMTRDSDISLDDGKGGSKKQADMRCRKNLVEEIQPDLMISIHQNSYPSENVRGAQTFYYHTSDNSEYLANCIQNSLIEYADPDNTRQHKSNSSYYILKNVSCPAALVECGFLSCPSECALLTSERYQDTLAYAIACGIRTYLNTK